MTKAEKIIYRRSASLEIGEDFVRARRFPKDLQRFSIACNRDTSLLRLKQAVAARIRNTRQSPFEKVSLPVYLTRSRTAAIARSSDSPRRLPIARS